MNTVSTAFAEDHRRCDDLFARLEESLSHNRWSEVTEGFSKFTATLERHLAIEEESLFPALEEHLGTPLGPVEVMRSEHVSMRELIQQLEQEISRQDSARCLSLCETLLILIQQHNLKEEQVLYHMADEALPAERAQTLAAMTRA